MERKFKSKILESVYEDAQALFEIGAISEEEMREYDRDCLVKQDIPAGRSQKASEIKVVPVYASGK